MMTTTSPDRVSRLEKAVLVYKPDSKESCRFDFRVDCNTTTDEDEGSIFLRFTAFLANLGGRPKVLTLHIVPEIINGCTLARLTKKAQFPFDDFSMVPGASTKTKVSDILILSLSLDETGTFLCPSEMGSESLSPADSKAAEFHAFSKICQSTHLDLYFCARQFVGNDLDRLQQFLDALQRKDVKAKTYVHKRHGVVGKTSDEVSRSLDPPAYCENPVPEQVAPLAQLVGKRQRESPPPYHEPRKRALRTSPQIPCSPGSTEPNTPSDIPSPSPPPIRSTCFTRASSPDCKGRDLKRLGHTLRGLSDDQIRELLIQAGRHHLLAPPDDVESDLPLESGKMQVQHEPIEPRFKQYIDTAIEDRLKDYVNYVEKTVDSYREEIIAENEAEIRERVEDGKADIGITADDRMKELNEQTQESMDEIKGQAQPWVDQLEEQAQQYMDDIADRETQFKVVCAEEVAKLCALLLLTTYVIGTQALANSHA